MKTAGKFLGLFVCLLVLLSFLEVLQLPLVYSSVSQTPPTIQDFWVNSTWANQASQFAFNVTDSNGLVSATLQTNCTGSNSNSTINLSGTSAWANYTVMLPSSSSVVSFQFWVWNTNNTIYATTGTRTILVYPYNNTANAWNTPYEYLGQAIQNIDAANTWNSSIDMYAQVILNHQPQSALSSLIDNYTAAQDWVDVLKWSAFVNKLNITQQTDIKYALGNFTMCGSLPEQNPPWNNFYPGGKWGLYGYYFNAQSWMGSYQNNTKWNISAAYNQFNSSCYYSVLNTGGLPYTVNADGTGNTATNRYYDEDACCIECYLLFDELLNVSDGMNQALYWWSYTNVVHWNGYYYGYTSLIGLECEAPFFLKIITELKYYYPLLGNWTNVLGDIGFKFLSDEWTSGQWMDYVNDLSTYAVVHLYNYYGGGYGNNERRLENTLGAWQALLGIYQKLNSTYQNNMVDMLSGNNNTQPAWALLLTPDLASNNQSPATSGITGSGAGLYNSTAKMFSWESADNGYFFVNDPSATAWGEILLFMMGIVPQTTTIAFPIEELNYEYNYDIDPQIMNINNATCSIEIPIATAGTLTFQYGVSPITYYFNQSGVWTVSFTDSWNNIASVTYKGSPAHVIPEYPTHILLALAMLQTLTILIILRRKRKKSCERNCYLKCKLRSKSLSFALS